MDEIQKKILIAREYKYREMQFLKNTFKSVISVKSNIPGVKKQINISYLLVNYFRRLIPLDMVDYFKYYDGYDGPYFLLGSNLEPDVIKQQLVTLEDTNPIGRFIDLDVFDGEQMLSRGKMRKCFICGSDAFVCMKESKHSDNELIQYISNCVYDHLNRDTITKVNASIMAELELHPKFGLVTPISSGSHLDMNYEIMLNAKEAILPYFEKMFEIGYTAKGIDNIFPLARNAGLKAEEAMLFATKGVNAYKGLIFNFGILISAYGYLLFNNIGVENVFDIVKLISKDVLKDFDSEGSSFGKFAYEKYGFTGARGEAYYGFPTVKKAMSYLNDLSWESRIRTLAFLISESQDTVLLKRTNDISKYREIRLRFKKLISDNLEGIEKLNEFCITNNLSFGGSADLLVLSVFLWLINH